MRKCGPNVIWYTLHDISTVATDITYYQWKETRATASKPVDIYRVLGVTMSSDLSLKKHVSAVCAACFFHLRQIRRVRQSLDAGPAATLIHAFVTSRVDYTVMPYWPGRRGSQQTISCSEWWILLPASSATLGSSMAVCRGYCMTSSTGSTSLTEYMYSSSSPCWCIDVFMKWLRCTWWTAAPTATECLQLPVVFSLTVLFLAVVISWSS